jgi:hypothetical protein
VTTPDAVTRKAPDLPQTFLAFRVWRLHRPTKTLLSLNAPRAKSSWVATALASPDGAWPQDGAPGGRPAPLVAKCTMPPPRARDGEDEPPPHGPVPARKCSCGIYATTSLDVINGYLHSAAPVLGVVELGGRVIPATNGYRAAVARIAAILLIDEALTVPHTVLHEAASAYQVPALVPHSLLAEDYRPLLAPSASLADEAEDWLRQHGT